MSILEGMSCGIPVAISDNSGAADLVVDGVNGFIITAQNSLEKLFSNLPASEKLIIIGRVARIIAENYSWQRVTEHYEKVFYDVLKEKCLKKYLYSC